MEQREFPPMTADQARLLNPLQLAYIGDSVWDLLIRSRLIYRGRNVHTMHRDATSRVNAGAQAAALARAAERCEAALYAAQSGMTPDAVVMDAEGAITALGEITGETVTDAVVTRIFIDFCVGK